MGQTDRRTDGWTDGSQHRLMSHCPTVGRRYNKSVTVCDGLHTPGRKVSACRVGAARGESVWICAARRGGKWNRQTDRQTDRQTIERNSTAFF